MDYDKSGSARGGYLGVFLSSLGERRDGGAWVRMGMNKEESCWGVVAENEEKKGLDTN